MDVRLSGPGEGEEAEGDDEGAEHGGVEAVFGGKFTAWRGTEKLRVFGLVDPAVHGDEGGGSEQGADDKPEEREGLLRDGEVVR